MNPRQLVILYSKFFWGGLFKAAGRQTEFTTDMTERPYNCSTHPLRCLLRYSEREYKEPFQIQARGQSLQGKTAAVTEPLLLTGCEAGLLGGGAALALFQSGAVGADSCNGSCDSLPLGAEEAKAESGSFSWDLHIWGSFPQHTFPRLPHTRSLVSCIPVEVFPMMTGAWGYLTLASRSSFRVTGEIHVILSPPKTLVLCGCFSAIIYWKTSRDLRLFYDNIFTSFCSIFAGTEKGNRDVLRNKIKMT